VAFFISLCHGKDKKAAAKICELWIERINGPCDIIPPADAVEAGTVYGTRRHLVVRKVNLIVF